MPAKTQLTEVITRCHRHLDEIFLLHQEAVLLGRFDSATKLLACYKELHHLHMDFEDNRLIPKLAEIGGPGRWPASLYTDEHTKVRDLLKKTENNLFLLGEGQLSGKSLRREIIDLLDWEKTFKGLCEHHQEREETGMLPELDKETGEKWRASVIELFLAGWDDCVERNMLIVDGIDLS